MVKNDKEFKDALGKLDGMLTQFNNAVEKAKYYVAAKLLMGIFVCILIGYLMAFIHVPLWTLCFPIAAFSLMVGIELKQRNKNGK
jgi:hypothetical protein